MQCGVFSLQVLGTGSLGTHPSIVATSDTEKILFDCGDGTQRLCTEHKVRVSKITRVYLTRNDPFTMGGLGGFLLTRSDLSTGGKTSIVGPPGVGQMMKSFRYFYGRPNCLVSVFEVGCQQFPTTTADGISISPIIVGGPASLNEARQNEKRRRTSASELGRGYEIFESDNLYTSEDEISYSVSYILQLPEKRGKFHPDKALALGVKPGPDFGKLTKGITITTADGRVVTPEECLDRTELPGIAVILSCPTEHHLKTLMNSPSISMLQNEKSNQVLCVFHLAPTEVLNSPHYQEFSSKFNSNVKHIAVGENISPTRSLYNASSRLQCRLSYLDQEAFPFREPTSITNQSILPSRIDAGDILAKFVLLPTRLIGIDLSQVPSILDPIAEIKATSELLREESSSSTTTNQSGAFEQLSVSKVQEEVVFLGTGSAIPSKYRNVTGMYLKISPEVGGIMVDCGEGSVGQLARHFGAIETAREAIYNLSFLWISHMHADHHLGLLTVLAERIAKGDLPPLVVAGPTILNHFLNEYAKSLMDEDATKFKASIAFLDCEAMLADKEVKAPALNQLLRLARLKTAVSIPVIHCNKAYGLFLESLSGWKFLFSGDTEYCPELIRQGMNADVLIHEATFEDEKVDEAKEKKHSTVSQALQVATEMNAKTVVFTHFSQRYPKNPPLPTSIETQTIGVFAFDLMSFKPEYARRLAEKAKQFNRLFEEEDECEEEEDA